MAEELANKFNDLGEIQNLTVADLTTKYGFKPASSHSLVDWLSVNSNIIEQFKTAGIF